MSEPLTIEQIDEWDRMALEGYQFIGPTVSRLIDHIRTLEKAMTCEPIEIICEDCGRLLVMVNLAAHSLTETSCREIEAFILKMHREAAHSKEQR
jgi:hypothetical protein